MCARALRRFISAHATVADQPVAVFLRGFAQLALTGDADLAKAAARAALAQLFTFHSPDDVRIAVCCDARSAPDWEWVKWLPHSQVPAQADAAGPVRALRSSLAEVVALLGEEFGERPRHEPGTGPSRDEPYVVVVLDGGDVSGETRFVTAGYRNAVLIDVGGTIGWRHSKRVLRLDFTRPESGQSGPDHSLDMVQARSRGLRSAGAISSPSHTRGPARGSSPRTGLASAPRSPSRWPPTST